MTPSQVRQWRLSSARLGSARLGAAHSQVVNAGDGAAERALDNGGRVTTRVSINGLMVLMPDVRQRLNGEVLKHMW